MRYGSMRDIVGPRNFASDNYATALDGGARVIAANHGPAVLRRRRVDARRRSACAAFGGRRRVPGPTARAPTSSLRAMLRPWQGVIAEGAHLVDEASCQVMGGIVADRPDARRSAGVGTRRLVRIGDDASQPGVSLPSRPSARSHAGRDGGDRRLAHALGCCARRCLRLSPTAAPTCRCAVTTDIGADVVSFGGTRRLVLGEAVPCAPDAGALRYLRKQSMQLASRCAISAQLEALLTDDLWRRAGHANAMARRRRGGRGRHADPGGAGQRRRDLPRARGRLRDFPYFWDDTREVRWMCAWTRARGRRRVRGVLRDSAAI
jgi:threonine aldolase